MLFRRTQDRTFIPWITSAIWVSLAIMVNLRLIIAMIVSLLASGCQTPQVSTARTTESLAIQHREIMDWFAGEHFRRSGYNALKAPQNYNQAYSCLRSDNIAQFRYGMAQGERLGGPRGLSLYWQLHLAWSEALATLATVQRRIREEFAPKIESARKRVDSNPFNDRDLAFLNDLLRRYDELESLAQALEQESILMMQKAAPGIRYITDTYRDSYLVHRVAADYYRMTGDWEGFDKATAEVERLNPASVGLIFARAQEALLRFGDIKKTRSLLNQALLRDPEFARARVHLMMLEPNFGRFERELVNFARYRPTHQLVVWVQPLLRELSMLSRRGMQSLDGGGFQR